MKKHIYFGLIILAFLLFPLTLMAEDYLAKADATFAQGSIENLKKAIGIYLKAIQADPSSYEANWKTARAYREYCEWSIREEVSDWKKICATYAKKGMGFGEKAIELNPKGVEGHFYYGLCVGNYADGVSILTALKQGLKGKTQNAFETAYKLDKMYKDAGPVIANGRFWSVLPWPLKKKKKAINYYKEAISHYPNNPEIQVYYGEILMDSKKSRAEAKQLLEKAAASNDPYFSKVAKDILTDLK